MNILSEWAKRQAADEHNPLISVQYWTNEMRNRGVLLNDKMSIRNSQLANFLL